LLTPQVLPTRCACLRQLTERTDGCIGGYEGPVGVSTHAAGYAEAQRSSTLPLSTAAASHASTPGPSLVRGSGLAGLSSRPAWYPTRGMPPAAARLLQAAPSSSCSTDALVDSAALPAPTFTLVSGAARRQCRLHVELGSSTKPPGFRLNRSEIEQSKPDGNRSV
jgi:hypothetical protein